MATRNDRNPNNQDSAEALSQSMIVPAHYREVDMSSAVRGMPAMPPLGSTCVVRVAAGVVLMNNETGARFEPEVDTPVTVTVTLLRRLQDGDLTLVG